MNTNRTVLICNSSCCCILYVDVNTQFLPNCCRFQLFCLHQSALTHYLFGHWYFRSMSQSAYRCLSIVEAMPGHHLMEKIENAWVLGTHFSAAWPIGPCQLHAKLIQQVIFSGASMMACTGIWGRLSLLMVLGNRSKIKAFKSNAHYLSL